MLFKVDTVAIEDFGLYQEPFSTEIAQTFKFYAGFGYWYLSERHRTLRRDRPQEKDEIMKVDEYEVRLCNQDFIAPYSAQLSHPRAHQVKYTSLSLSACFRIRTA